jgi:type IV pilus assembly protein PilP
MSMWCSRIAWGVSVLAGTLAVAGVACDRATTTGPTPPPPNRGAAAASASAAPPVRKGPDFTENDFVESDRNRDPFRSFFQQNLPAQSQVQNQRHPLIADYSIDELRLIAIVQGSDQPRAMFVDPSGKGTVVYKGTFLCRPEIIHLGAANGPVYELNWRVDRIRDGDVVLIREDPAQPAIPPATRVIPLHPEADKEVQGNVPG